MSVGTRLDDLNSKLTRACAVRDRAVQESVALGKARDETVRLLEDAESARTYIQTVAQLTQEELQHHVSDLVTLALRSVFGDEYEFVVRFVTKRGRTEADLILRRGDEEIEDVMGSVGGGVVDVVAFALRLTMWTLRRPKTRPIMVMDEPFKHLSAGLQPLMAGALKELSKKMGVQMLIVTHEDALVEDTGADVVFHVGKKKGKTQCR